MRQYRQSSIRRCNLCKLALCRTHSLGGFCPTHASILSNDEKTALRTAMGFQKGSCWLGCLWMFILPLSAVRLFGTWNIGTILFLMLGMPIIIWIVVYAAARAAWQANANKINLRLQGGAGMNRATGTATGFGSLSIASPPKPASPRNMSGGQITGNPSLPPAISSQPARSCPQCDSPIPSSGDVTFCPSCGYPVSRTTTPAALGTAKVMNDAIPTGYTASMLGNKTILAFLKEYLDFNFATKFPAILMSIILHVLPDGVEVPEHIVAYLSIKNGTCSVHLIFGRLPFVLPESIELLGSPSQWKQAIQTGNAMSLDNRGKVRFSRDATMATKASLVKSFCGMVKRVADRVMAGEGPSVPVDTSVLMGDDDLFQPMTSRSVKINVDGVAVGPPDHEGNGLHRRPR